jgi:hypothetical protein
MKFTFSPHKNNKKKQQTNKQTNKQKRKTAHGSMSPFKQ